LQYKVTKKETEEDVEGKNLKGSLKMKT